MLSRDTVAGNTFDVVMRGDTIGSLMGIVTCKATDPRIVPDEAFAQLKAVRLKANGAITVETISNHILKTAMASAAELGDLLGIEALERFREGSEVIEGRISHMLLSTFVTTLTSYARDRCRRHEFLAGYQPGGMALEASANFIC